MKAMVLAAGLGTRLRPLTDDRPKALVEVGGRTLLEITLRRLRSFGIGEVIINVHHFADMVVEYLKANGDFGMRIEISREDELLDTGGGLKKAADFFLRDSVPGKAADAPFLLHNVDVLSAIDLGKMVKFHRQQDALATLAVQQRKSSRYLLLDAQLQLCGRLTAGEAQAEMARAALQTEAWAFAGIHVISPRIFELMSAELMSADRMSHDGGQQPQAFSIIPEYLRLAGGGEKILGFRADGYYWRDLGTLASLKQAAEDMGRKLIEP
jgi:NDP-sugar pyrophosphorylase family protein